jgi:hypothetical protein
MTSPTDAFEKVTEPAVLSGGREERVGLGVMNLQSSAVNRMALIAASGKKFLLDLNHQLAAPRADPASDEQTAHSEEHQA